MIEAYENMSDMEKVRNNFPWIFTVLEMEGLKWNHQMTHGFLMKLEIIVVEHPKHQKWKNTHIHQRKMVRKKGAASTSLCPLKCDVFSRTASKYSLLALPQLPSKMCWPLSGPSYRAPLSFGMTLHGYSYDFITLAVNHQEPQFQLAPRTIYHWNNLSWQWLYSKILSNIAQYYSKGKHTTQQRLLSSTFPLRQENIIIIALKKPKC